MTLPDVSDSTSTKQAALSEGASRNRPDHASGLRFWASETFLSAIEIELFTKLAKHPEDAQPLRDRLELHPGSALVVSAGNHGTG